MGLAGVTPEDIDVGGLYDCFTVTVLRNLEEMGFCKLGEAKDFIKDGGIRLGGRLPVNTDGGLLSNSHNGNPGGLPVIEVVRQLRRDVEPARQVKDAKVGLALSQGMSIHGVGGVLVLGV
jgi:acetyl-CoA acetyltransferase